MESKPQDLANQIDSGDQGEDEEMSYEQFLVYSARIGEIDDVKEMMEVTDPPVDVNF